MGKDSLSNCCFNLCFSDCDIYIFIHHLLFLLLSITCTYSLPIFLASGLSLWIDKILDFLILEENVMCKTSHPGDTNLDVNHRYKHTVIWKVATCPSCSFSPS